jgi:hypothetical protein
MAIQPHSNALEEEPSVSFARMNDLPNRAIRFAASTAITFLVIRKKIVLF